MSASPRVGVQLALVGAGSPERGEAALFEEIAWEQSRFEDPAGSLTVCETALRNGVRTPAILYAYGTALRLSRRLTEARAALALVDPETEYKTIPAPRSVFTLPDFASRLPF